jgi:uncharacterized protein (TIGR02147 family)
MSNLYDYLNYRDFLRDRLALEKQKGNGLNSQKLAEKAEVDPGTVSRILQGTRNMSRKLARKMSEALGLKKREAKYFDLLVQFNQSKSETQQKEHLEKLLNLKKVNPALISRQQYDLFENWYNLAICELINVMPFHGDYDELARNLDPPIRPRQAEKAVQLLLKLNLIKKDRQSRYAVTDKFISTGETWHSVAIHNMQRSTIDLARDALDRLPKAERDFSSVTLSLSKDSFQKAQEKLKEFRASLMEIAQSDNDVEGVYQFNFQAFPLSRNSRGDCHA